MNLDATESPMSVLPYRLGHSIHLSSRKSATPCLCPATIVRTPVLSERSNYIVLATTGGSDGAQHEIVKGPV